MKRVDLFGSSGDEDANAMKQLETDMLVEAKRQKIKNLEGLAKELEETEPVSASMKPVAVAPIYIDLDCHRTSNDDEPAREFDSDNNVNTMLPFDEAELELKSLEGEEAFVAQFGNYLRRLDLSRKSIEEVMVFVLDNYGKADTVIIIFVP